MGDTSDNRHGAGGWVRVSTARPCPVCEKPDWCLVSPDGDAAICQRVEPGSAKTCGDAGWLHRLRGPAPPPTRAGRKPAAAAAKKPDAPDWHARARELVGNFTPTARTRLAAALGLPADVFDRMPLVGAVRTPPADAAWTFPECDGAGNVIGLLRRFVTPRRGGKNKLAMKGGRRGLALVDGWRDRPGPVWLVEGPSDALALAAAGLAAVGRPSNSGGADLLADLLADWPADRGVVVVGENDRKENGDWPGRDGAERVTRALAGRLNRPVRLALPPDGSKDVRDWLTAAARAPTPWPDRGADLAARLTAAATPVEPPAGGGASTGPGGRPRIVIGVDEYRVNEEAAAGLAAEGDLYQRGGVLVQVFEQPAGPDGADVIRRPAGAPVVRALPRTLLRDRLTRAAEWFVVRGRGETEEVVPAHPPDWCVGAVHDRGDWPAVRRLDAIVTHPVLLPDGQILAASGYHARYRLLACLPPGSAVEVPESPTAADVAAAVATLLDPLADFPFQAPAHRAAWVAGLLTPLARFAFAGPAPLFLVDGNVRGVGKGLLADVAALILTGRRFSVMSYTNDREELQKRITALVMEGEELVLLDNLAGAVGNDILDAALTGDRWKGRVLGASRTYDGPLAVTWFGTGNNVQLHADTSRRTCHVRMESADERPETKAGFRHPNLRDHVLRNRPTLLAAALTILRGWDVAGRPTHGLRPWGSYEDWSAVVREAVVFAGLPDPGETREALQSTADRDACAMADVLAGLEHLDDTGRGLTTGEIVDRIRGAERPTECLANLRAAVEELCGRLCGRALGYKFRHFARRNFGGKCLDSAGDGKHASRWRVRALTAASAPKHPPHPTDPPPRAADETGDAGDAGDVPAGGGRLWADDDGYDAIAR